MENENVVVGFTHYGERPGYPLYLYRFKKRGKGYRCYPCRASVVIVDALPIRVMLSCPMQEKL